MHATSQALDDARARALRKHAVSGRVCTLTAAVVLLVELALVRHGSLLAGRGEVQEAVAGLLAALQAKRTIVRKDRP